MATPWGTLLNQELANLVSLSSSLTAGQAHILASALENAASDVQTGDFIDTVKNKLLANLGPTEKTWALGLAADVFNLIAAFIKAAPGLLPAGLAG